MFESYYNQAVLHTVDGIPCFGREEDGDCFDEEDIASWRAGRFQSNFETRKFSDNPVTAHLLESMCSEKEVVDLACGPGMGLIPSLLQRNPEVHCLATDANISVLTEWKRFLVEQGIRKNIGFAQFSAFDIPFRDNCVKAYSSNLGLGSTRDGSRGYDKAVSEVRRTLVPGGRLYTIEVEWTHIPAILDLFRKMNREPWHLFVEAQENGYSSWEDRFRNAGFRILYHDIEKTKPLAADDNELGVAAARFRVDAEMCFHAFIVEK